MASFCLVCGCSNYSLRLWLDRQRTALGFRKVTWPIRRLLLRYRPTDLLALFQANTFSDGAHRWIADRCRRNRNLFCKGIDCGPFPEIVGLTSSWQSWMSPESMSHQPLLKNIS